jgi:glycine/D-amino acid oxidase-like deaminating enzyme
MEILKALKLDVPKSFLIGGQSLVWKHHPSVPPRILVKATLSLAVLPDRKILGSSSWKAEPGYEPDLSEDRNQLLEQGARAFGFACPNPEAVQSNRGTRLRFADRMPALGFWPGMDDKLSVLTGFYKNGLQLADLCAEQLLKEIQGEPLNEFGEAFHVNRFFRSGRRAPGSPPRHCLPGASEHKTST